MITSLCSHAATDGIEIHGSVRNQRNNRAIAGADITVVGTNIGTITNSDGVFTLKLPTEHANASLIVR